MASCVVLIFGGAKEIRILRRRNGRGETVRRARLLVEASLDETRQTAETLQQKTAPKTRGPRSSIFLLAFGVPEILK